MLANAARQLVWVAALLLISQQAFAQDGALSVSDFKLVIEAADGSTVSTLKGAYPSKVLANPQVPHTQTLQATFSVKKGSEAFKPQQVMLVLTSEETGVAAYAIGKAKRDAYTITINAAAVEKQLGKQGGKFSARLVLGDVGASAGVSWELGPLELLLAPGAGLEPKDAVRTAKFQPINDVKPEIVHMFRAPDKRAPPAVSLAFTAVVLLPLLAVVGYNLGVLKINFKGFPVEGTTRLAALGFHASIAAMLFLYLLFWLKLNLAETLPLVLAGGLTVALTGYFTLSGLAAERLKKD